MKIINYSAISIFYFRYKKLNISSDDDYIENNRILRNFENANKLSDFDLPNMAYAHYFKVFKYNNTNPL